MYFPPTEKNAPLKGKKGTLWEGGTRVPALMYSPLLEDTPREYSGLLHVTDWHNTLLAIAGASIFPENDGFNQWEALRTGLAVYPRDSFIYNLDFQDNEAKGAIRYACCNVAAIVAARTIPGVSSTFGPVLNPVKISCAISKERNKTQCNVFSTKE